jgi:ankyrin repeat protein
MVVIFMNFKSLFKPTIIAILAIGISHATLAMKNVEANSKLLVCSHIGDIAAVLKAIKDGADINHENKKKGYRPLHLASLYNHPEITKLLIDSGANINLLDIAGATPLHLTSKIYPPNPEAAKILVDCGADINLPDNDGNIPLHYATYMDSEIAKLFIDRGVNINHANKFGLTPLHNTVEYNLPKIAKLLLDNGADSNCASNDGETAFDMARSRRGNTILTLMLNADQEKFQSICNIRLLEKLNINNMQTNLAVLIPFSKNRE